MKKMKSESNFFCTVAKIFHQQWDASIHADRDGWDDSLSTGRINISRFLECQFYKVHIIEYAYTNKHTRTQTDRHTHTHRHIHSNKKPFTIVNNWTASAAVQIRWNIEMIDSSREMRQLGTITYGKRKEKLSAKYDVSENALAIAVLWILRLA